MSELGSVNRNGLIAGDHPTKTQEITLTGPVSFLRGDVVGVTASGLYGLVDSTQTNGLQTPIGIICDDITVENDATAISNMYIKGEFAIRFLRFGGSDTAETHIRHMIEIGLLIKKTKVEGGSFTWQ